MPRIDVLNATGHLSLDWSADDPAQVEAVRREVAALRAAGYTFWLTETEPADAVAAGRGHLLVRRVDDPITALSGIQESMPEVPDPVPQASRRGRRPKSEAAVVAVRPMAGG